MVAAPGPREIYETPTREGDRRLDMPLVEQAVTGFVAGATIIFGIVALGAVGAVVAPAWGRGPATPVAALGALSPHIGARADAVA
jgi:formate-nitrite transporter family protein